MASIHNSLGDELKCPICLGFLKDPKSMGKCLHAACLSCLKTLVAGSSSFRCPICREMYEVPQGGVENLQGEFKLNAILAKYLKMEIDKSLVKCIACPNPARHLCKTCDVSLCRDCSRKHSRIRLMIADHELVGICSKHGKILDGFCRECNKAICCVCLIDDHPIDSHTAVLHQEVAEQEAAAVADALEKLDITREQKETARGNIIVLHDRVVETINSDLVELERQTDYATESVDNKYAVLKAESSDIKVQIKTLTKQKDTIDKHIIQTKKQGTFIRQQKEEISKHLKDYRAKRMNEYEEVIISATAEIDDITAKLDLGRKESSPNRLLDDQAVPSLVKVKETLTKAIIAADQLVDRVAPFADAMEKMPRFVTNSALMEMAYGFRREFSKLMKCADISFPANRPLVGLFSVVPLADGRLTSLYRSTNDKFEADTICFHDPASPTVPQMIIDTNIYPAVDMTVTSKGELMVLRTVKPNVRVFNIHSRDFRKIYLDVDTAVINNVRSFATTEEEIIFVVIADAGACDGVEVEVVEDEENKDEEEETDEEEEKEDEDEVKEYGEVEEQKEVRLRTCRINSEVDVADHLCVFIPDGVLINKVKASFSLSPKISYCRFTKKIYVANVQNILRYHWDRHTLKVMPPLQHGVNGFECTDISTDNDGQVFAAGTMTSTNEVVVFQVVETKQPIKEKELATAGTSCNKRDDSTEFKMIKLHFDDNVVRKIADDWFPIISVFGNALALGLKESVELFHLKP